MEHTLIRWHDGFGFKQAVWLASNRRYNDLQLRVRLCSTLTTMTTAMNIMMQLKWLKLWTIIEIRQDTAVQDLEVY